MRGTVAKKIRKISKMGATPNVEMEVRLHRRDVIIGDKTLTAYTNIKKHATDSKEYVERKIKRIFQNLNQNAKAHFWKSCNV